MKTTSLASRREVVAGLGAATAAASLAAPRESAAQTPSSLKIIDFHNHYMGASWSGSLTTMNNAGPAGRARWERINARLVSEDALVKSLEEAHIAGRVINAPTAFIEDADGKVPAGAQQRINDEMARLVAKFPGKLYGLATVDAFAGDAGARELTRAVRELGLRGVFVESAKGDLLLGAKETRPMLAAAASLGVLVFVHPQTDAQLHNRFSRIGPIGMRLARGTVNSAALISLLESGTFDEIANLRVVVTTLALGGILLAGGFGNGQNIRSDAPAVARRHIYVDTMGLNPAVVRASVDLLGADHVLMGTDWPIVEEKEVPERLRRALVHSGLDAAQQQMVAGGNALKLLGAV